MGLARFLMLFFFGGFPVAKEGRKGGRGFLFLLYQGPVAKWILVCVFSMRGVLFLFSSVSFFFLFSSCLLFSW
jgi:hypothetical protein